MLSTNRNTINIVSRNDSIRFGFFALLAGRFMQSVNARESPLPQTSATRMISLRFLGSDEISSKSIHLEGRIMAVVPATAVAANVSTGRMKVVLLLVPRPPLPSFLFSFLRVSSVRTNKRDLHADLRAGSNRLISNRFGSRRVSFFLLLSLLSSLNRSPLYLLSSSSSFAYLHLPILPFFFFSFQYSLRYNPSRYALLYFHPLPLPLPRNHVRNDAF